MAHFRDNSLGRTASEYWETEVRRNELLELRSRIDKLLGPVMSCDARPLSIGTLSKDNFALGTKVRRILKFRDTRSEVLGSDIFADPAWDMLLELFVCDLSQQRISVSAACFSGRVPPTTGLRWLKALESRGLVQRAQDPLDARRTFVSLTDTAFTKMRLLMESPLLDEAELQRVKGK